MDQDATTWYGGWPRPRPHNSLNINICIDCSQILHSDKDDQILLQWYTTQIRQLLTSHRRLIFPLSVTRPFPQIDVIGAVVIVWRREIYQVCSVQYCAQCNAHTWTDLTVLCIGFCLTGPISLCLDSFLYMQAIIVCMHRIVAWWGGPGGIEAWSLNPVYTIQPVTTGCIV